jgi:predicted TIM-barrel fold metal-dependent hydrolase
MILDAHTHVGHFGEVWSKEFADAMLGQFGKFPKWWGDRQPWKAEEFNVEVNEYVQHMDEIGVDRAIVWGLACEPFACRTPPEIIAEAVAQYPDRFIGFHTSDPIGYPDDGPDELERAVTQLGLKGVKIYPGYNNGTPNDPRLFPLYQKANDLDIPVVVHTGYTVTHSGPNSYAPLMQQYPLYLEEVAATFPKLRLVMAHFANPWAEDAIQLMRKYDNVYADTAYGAFPFSWKVNALAWAKNFGVLHKVLFGSDYPLHSPGQSIALHQRMPEYTRKHDIEPNLTEADIENVLGRNAARMLRLEV